MTTAQQIFACDRLYMLGPSLMHIKYLSYVLVLGIVGNFMVELSAEAADRYSTMVGTIQERRRSPVRS